MHSWVLLNRMKSINSTKAKNKSAFPLATPSQKIYNGKKEVETMYINTDALFSVIWMIIWFLIIFLVVRTIWRAIKRFIFELIDHANGTGTGASGASKKDYTREARNACEKVTPKKDKNATPPWEE